jgi:hypothetical protein
MGALEQKGLSGALRMHFFPGIKTNEHLLLSSKAPESKSVSIMPTAFSFCHSGCSTDQQKYVR